MKYKSIMALVLGGVLAACNSADKKANTEKDEPIIGKASVKVENGIMTPEVLYSFGRVSDVQVSPDKSKILYGVTYVSIEQNKTNKELFTMNVDGSDKKQITQTPKSENNAIWVKVGTKIAFLSSESGSSQIWEMNPDGTARKQLTQYDGDIEGFSFSPDGKKLLFIAQVKTVQSTADKHPDLPKATGIIVTDLMYKHWDEWVTTAPHPFVADFDGNNISNIQDILDGEPYESPMKPWGV